MTKEMEEQIRIDQIKQQTLEIRQERIRKIMEKEAQLKNEIILKAREYMNNFYEELIPVLYNLRNHMVHWQSQ